MKDGLKLVFGFVGIFLFMAVIPIMLLLLVVYVIAWMAIDIIKSIEREGASDEDAAKSAHQEERKEWCYYYNADKEKHGKA